MNSTLKHLLLGACVGLCGAATYATLLVAVNDEATWMSKPVAVGWWLCMTAWIVVPTGALLGLMIPRATANNLPVEATLCGLALGLISGLVIAGGLLFFLTLFSLNGPAAFFQPPGYRHWLVASLFRQCLPIVPFCAAVGGIWALFVALWQERRTTVRNPLLAVPGFSFFDSYFL